MRLPVSTGIYSLAKKLSKKSDHPTYRLGCVIFKKQRIIGLGNNKLRTHPKSPNPFFYVHAEFDATVGVLPHELKGANVFVYMEKNSHNVGLAKPCQHCEKMLTSLGIKKVFYTTRNNQIDCLELN